MSSRRFVFELGFIYCVFTLLGSSAGDGTSAVTGRSCTWHTIPCQHQDDVCFGSYCARMAGRNCSGGPTTCVPGAECSAEVCRCSSSRTEKGGLCLSSNFRKVGGACNPEEGVTACYDHAANCNSITGAPGVSGVCICMKGYMETKDQTCQMGAAPTNDPCAFGFLCQDGDTCMDGYCKRKSDESCDNHFDCVPNANCEGKQNSVCRCMKPYRNESGLCVAPPGLIYGRCNPTEKDSCQDISAYCLGYNDKGTCFCKDNYYTSGALGCEAKSRALHGPCNVNQNNACHDVNAECQQTTQGTFCRCKQGYEQTVDDRCLASAIVGASHSPCGVRSSCKNDGDRCSDNVCRRAAESLCSSGTDDKCVSGATCESDKCTCMRGLRAFRGYCYRILQSVGGTCLRSDGDQACNDELAQCVESNPSGVGVCVCSGTDLLKATMDGTCSTAVSATASFLLLTLTALTSFVAL